MPVHKINAHGVMHTRNPIPEAQGVFAKLKQRELPKELGVEYLHDEKNFELRHEPDVFWKEVARLAHENGIQLRHLEDGRQARTFYLANDYVLLAQNSIVMRRPELFFDEPFLKRCERTISKEMGDPLQRAIVSAISDEISAHPTIQHLQSMFDALSFHRSLLMHKRAKELRLSDIVIGEKHAGDIGKNHLFEGRLRNYKSRIKFIRKINELAKSSQVN